MVILIKKVSRSFIKKNKLVNNEIFHIKSQLLLAFFVCIKILLEAIVNNVINNTAIVYDYECSDILL